MAAISKVIRRARGFFEMISGWILDLQTADPTAVANAGLLYYRSDLKRLRMQDDGGTFANLAREDAGTFSLLQGSGAAPTIVAGASAQMGTGPAAAIDAGGTPISMVATVTPGTTPTIFTANTPIVFATITLPAGLAAAPNNVSVDAANQQAAQDETGTNGLAYYYDKAASTATSIVIKAVSKGTPTLSNAAYKLSIGITG
jgi:hypothetical protein